MSMTAIKAIKMYLPPGTKADPTKPRIQVSISPYLHLTSSSSRPNHIKTQNVAEAKMGKSFLDFYWIN
jgi:hypothetical protein